VSKQQRRNRKHDVIRLKREQRRIQRSPCSRPPETIAVTSLHGEYDRLEKGRHRKIRARLRWAEVHEDTSGFPITIRNYHVEWEYSADDVTYFEGGRFVVPAKDDNDPNEKAHYIVRSQISAKLAYRFRVRAISAGDGGCRGDWSDWKNLGTPGVEEPPSPSNVTIYANANDRVVTDWDAIKDPTDDDILDEKIEYFQVQVATAATFAANKIVKFDRFVHKTRLAVKMPVGGPYFTRARSIGEDKHKSAWIPATLAGNSDPNATADGVNIVAGGAGKTKHKWSVLGRLREVDESDTHDLDIDEAMTLTKIRLRVKQAPLGGPITVKMYKNNTTLISTTNISAGSKRGVDDTLGAALADGDSISPEISAVGTTFAGRNLTIVAVLV
jgi:hypothetical protein